MHRGVSTSFLLTFAFLLIFAFLFLQFSRDAISDNNHIISFSATNLNITKPNNHSNIYNNVIRNASTPLSHRVCTVDSFKDSISTASILFPDWEILVVVSPESSITLVKEDYVCLFQNNHTSPARFAGVMPFTNRTTFKCAFPNSVRRLRPFIQPILTKSSSEKQFPIPMPELLRWNFLAYESLSTDDDIVLFVKGVNRRQGINRSPIEFMCVFEDVSKTNTVKTTVTSSVQEVFRCPHPNITMSKDDQIKISLEIISENFIVPSVAYYTPKRTVATPKTKSQLCVCTMVYNVAKFLKEWVTYHSKIGVDRFILYDNDSNDDLNTVVDDLNKNGYNVTTLFWIWPKTQEAGFSHSAVYANSSCTWMMYVDVDEFVFSPSWNKLSQPSDQLLQNFIPKIRTPQTVSSFYRKIGQVLMRCNEFGPSNQQTHPVEGVMQGYMCRRRVGERHKSIVLLDAVDYSLLNVVHHFLLSSDYRYKQITVDKVVVNHYKYQAWPEFQSKFRRRVSTYVVDWQQTINLNSKDRTPGLGFNAIEPKGWATKFCEVNDNRLKMLTVKWFGNKSHNGFKMASLVDMTIQS